MFDPLVVNLCGLHQIDKVQITLGSVQMQHTCAWAEVGGRPMWLRVNVVWVAGSQSAFRHLRTAVQLWSSRSEQGLRAQREKPEHQNKELCKTEAGSLNELKWWNESI